MTQPQTIDQKRQAELRKLWRTYHEERSRIHQIWADDGYQYPPPVTPAFPEELRGWLVGPRRGRARHANASTFTTMGAASSTAD